MADSTAHQPAAIPPPREFRPLAAILAFVWPGLGHISIGEKRRGWLVMFGVLFLFFTGLLVGGFDAVDRVEQRLWFIAQALCGPIAYAADFVNQSHLKQLPEPQRLAVQGLARANEMGTLFIALAGLMNLVVILDALHFAPKPKPQPKRRSED